MNKFYGSLQTLPSNRLLFGMPEVPLTKSCPNQYWQYIEAPKFQYFNPWQQAKNKQKETVKGLSLWYTNHLTAMYAMQKYKYCRNEKSKDFNRQFVNVSKLKHQPLIPHKDSENCSKNMKLHQKKMQCFGKLSKAWEKYFENVIPGWSELKQTKKINSSLLKGEKSKALKKCRKDLKFKNKTSSSTQNSSSLVFLGPQSQQTQTSQKSMHQFSYIKQTQENSELSDDGESELTDCSLY